MYGLIDDIQDLRKEKSLLKKEVERARNAIANKNYELADEILKNALINSSETNVVSEDKSTIECKQSKSDNKET